MLFMLTAFYISTYVIYLAGNTNTHICVGVHTHHTDPHTDPHTHTHTILQTHTLHRTSETNTGHIYKYTDIEHSPFITSVTI